MSETPKRLSPTLETLRELYLKSGNVCAFPGCSAVLMDADGTFIGQLCHIEAAEPGGERFNEHMTNEGRRSASNLMLMCYPHHRTTNNVSRYPAEALRAMKAKHEARFTNPDGALRDLAAKAKWTTLVGTGLVAGVGFRDIVRGLQSLLSHADPRASTQESGSNRSELIKRLRLAPVGTIRFYTRDPIHAAVGDRIMELFQSAGWSLEQLNDVKIAPGMREHTSLAEAMLLVFHVPKESQASNASKAVLGIFEALGFSTPSKESPAELSEEGNQLRFFIIFSGGRSDA